MPLCTEEEILSVGSTHARISHGWNRAHHSSETQTASRRLQCNASQDKRWAVILAGGDGVRLRDLTQFICGDDRPKQFCPVLGPDTLLEQTRQRASRSILANQTIIALTRGHEVFFESNLEPLSQRLIQPSNRGTAPAIILSLLHIAAQAPNAVVAILPADHSFSDDVAFSRSLESAFEIAQEESETIVLIGAQPRGPEVEFGWNDLGAPVGEHLFRVRSFEEKPALPRAESLYRAGALWNTFVMVGNALAFLWTAFMAQPALLGQLEGSLPLKAEDGQLHAPSALYENMPKVDFSREVLAQSTHRLLALRLLNTDWHDLGHSERVVKAVRSSSTPTPHWLPAWERSRRSA